MNTAVVRCLGWMWNDIPFLSLVYRPQQHPVRDETVSEIFKNENKDISIMDCMGNHWRYHDRSNRNQIYPRPSYHTCFLNTRKLLSFQVLLVFFSLETVRYFLNTLDQLNISDRTNIVNDSKMSKYTMWRSWLLITHTFWCGTNMQLNCDTTT
jgi:hypothetical protein